MSGKNLFNEEEINLVIVEEDYLLDVGYERLLVEVNNELLREEGDEKDEEDEEEEEDEEDEEDEDKDKE